MGMEKSDQMLSPNTHKLSPNKNKVLTVINSPGLLNVNDASCMVRYAFFFHWIHENNVKTNPAWQFQWLFPPNNLCLSIFPDSLSPITFPVPTITSPIIWFRSPGPG